LKILTQIQVEEKMNFGKPMTRKGNQEMMTVPMKMASNAGNTD
jgi:hypothetical protein